jgi:hypothetical protein
MRVCTYVHVHVTYTYLYTHTHAHTHTHTVRGKRERPIMSPAAAPPGNETLASQVIVCITFFICISRYNIIHTHTHMLGSDLTLVLRPPSMLHTCVQALSLCERVRAFVRALSSSHCSRARVRVYRKLLVKRKWASQAASAGMWRKGQSDAQRETARGILHKAQVSLTRSRSLYLALSLSRPRGRARTQTHTHAHAHTHPHTHTA